MHDRRRIFVGRFYWHTQLANFIVRLTSPLQVLQRCAGGAGRRRRRLAVRQRRGGSDRLDDVDSRRAVLRPPRRSTTAAAQRLRETLLVVRLTSSPLRPPRSSDAHERFGDAVAGTFVDGQRAGQQRQDRRAAQSLRRQSALPRRHVPGIHQTLHCCTG